MDDSEIDAQRQFDNREKERAELARLRTALEQIREMAAEGLRADRVFVCHSFLSQIEATARAAKSTESN
jgi:hypothetical protein